MLICYFFVGKMELKARRIVKLHFFSFGELLVIDA